MKRGETLKLVAAVVQEYDANKLARAVVREGFRATIVGSTGGFLRTGNTTLISAVEDADVGALLAVIAANCRERHEMVRPEIIGDYSDWYPPQEVEVIVGGATVFVVAVTHFERIF